LLGTGVQHRSLLPLLMVPSATLCRKTRLKWSRLMALPALPRTLFQQALILLIAKAIQYCRPQLQL